MALGLETFQAYFKAHEHQYVLIGGAACHLLFDEAGLPFRVTKDLDIVLFVELIDADFVEVFWQFIRDGDYEIRQRNNGTPELFRFAKPKTDGFPYMIELFSKRQDALKPPEEAVIGRLTADGAEVSLSAILLDDDYYGLLTAARRDIEGVSLIGADLLIPLKARAFLDLSERKSNGEKVDSRHIAKHKKDIVNLSQLLAPADRFELPTPIRDDLATFIAALVKDEGFQPKDIGVKALREDIAELLSTIYQLTPEAS